VVVGTPPILVLETFAQDRFAPRKEIVDILRRDLDCDGPRFLQFAKLAELDFGSAPVFAVNGLKREELIATNSMILHECYFAGLGGDGQLAAGGLHERLAQDFGSLERWRGEFTAMGKALGGGSGWVLLVWSDRCARLVNQWAADHTHALAGATPILALDMYEHSYHIDYGAKAAAYVDAFMQNINWHSVAQTYEKCLN